MGQGVKAIPVTSQPGICTIFGLGGRSRRLDQQPNEQQTSVWSQQTLPFSSVQVPEGNNTLCLTRWSLLLERWWRVSKNWREWLWK